jgi:hypothetical protein
MALVVQKMRLTLILVRRRIVHTVHKTRYRWGNQFQEKTSKYVQANLIHYRAIPLEEFDVVLSNDKMRIALVVAMLHTLLARIWVVASFREESFLSVSVAWGREPVVALGEGACLVQTWFLL